MMLGRDNNPSRPSHVMQIIISFPFRFYFCLCSLKLHCNETIYSEFVLLRTPGAWERGYHVSVIHCQSQDDEQRNAACDLCHCQAQGEEEKGNGEKYHR